MKLSPIPLLVILTGCCCWQPYPPQGNYHPYPTGQSVVNNSGYVLDVFQDGVPIARNVTVGQVLPVRVGCFQRTTSVVVTGHTEAGDYVGSDTYIFQFGAPEAWSVMRLYAPKPPD